MIFLSWRNHCNSCYLACVRNTYRNFVLLPRTSINFTIEPIKNGFHKRGSISARKLIRAVRWQVKNNNKRLISFPKGLLSWQRKGVDKSVSLPLCFSLTTSSSIVWNQNPGLSGQQGQEKSLPRMVTHFLKAVSFNIYNHYCLESFGIILLWGQNVGE